MTFSRSSASPSSVADSASGLAAVLVDPHDPAALQPPFGLQVDDALLLEDLEGARPELQAQDVAFPGQQVVLDVQPLHRLQVPADDGVGDEGAELGGLVAAVLDVVQRTLAQLEMRLVLRRTTP